MDGDVGGSDNDVVEIERLRADLAQEMQMKEMLEQSLGELQITVQELEKKADSVDDENNEWKTRHESQAEMNEQLQKQIVLLQERQTEARTNIRENRFPNKTPRDNQKQEVTAHFVRQLEKEQQILENQLRDMEWRLDQESKAYHKAIEEKKQHGIEIQAAKGLLTHGKTKRGPVNQKDSTNTTPRAIGNVNIQPDQRIIEARHGPIKKTAAVRNLPKLQ